MIHHFFKLFFKQYKKNWLFNFQFRQFKKIKRVKEPFCIHTSIFKSGNINLVENDDDDDIHDVVEREGRIELNYFERIF